MLSLSTYFVHFRFCGFMYFRSSTKHNKNTSVHWWWRDMKMPSPKYLEEIIFSKSHDGWSCIVKNYSSLKFIVVNDTQNEQISYREATKKCILCFYKIVPRETMLFVYFVSRPCRSFHRNYWQTQINGEVGRKAGSEEESVEKKVKLTGKLCASIALLPSLGQGRFSLQIPWWELWQYLVLIPLLVTLFQTPVL